MISPKALSTPVPTLYPTTEDFLTDLRSVLLDDSEALVDWQIRYSRFPDTPQGTSGLSGTPRETSGARFCFRVRLPDVSGTDIPGRMPGSPGTSLSKSMADGIRLSACMVSGEPPDAVPEVEGMEDFCPITYLTYRKGLGSYAVDKVHLAARRLGLSTTQTDMLVTIADQAIHSNDSYCPLYLALQAIFVAKEDQRIHVDHLRVLAEARAILDS